MKSVECRVTICLERNPVYILRRERVRDAKWSGVGRDTFACR
jgi:hypothetical protein